MRTLGGVVGVLALAVAFSSACGGDDDDDDVDESDAAVALDAAPCEVPAVVYLNDQGGAYTRGDPEDASANVSGVIDIDRTLDAWPHDNWAEVASCFRAALSEFNIDVVEEDPGDVAHTELVFTGPSFLGPGVNSVSASSCDVVAGRIVFVFGDVIGTDARTACEISVHQWGIAAAALDRAFECQDYMTLLSGCGPKTWVDDDVQCGDFSARACQCGNATQNSYQTLLGLFGPACD